MRCDKQKRVIISGGSMTFDFSKENAHWLVLLFYHLNVFWMAAVEMFNHCLVFSWVLYFKICIRGVRCADQT